MRANPAQALDTGVGSLGLLLAIGTTMILAASLVVLPTLMHLVDLRRRTAPTDQRGSADTVAAVAG